MTIIRITIAIMGFLAAVVLNAWIPGIAIVALAFLWRAWEALLLGLFVDLLWLPSGNIPFFTIGAILIVWVMEPIRKQFLV